MKDVHSARMYLDHRETSLGGYSTLSMEFYTGQEEGAIKVLVYVALPSNPQYLGPAPLAQIASDIVAAEGCNGHNVEYLAKLSAFMKLHVPCHHEDHHLQSLDENVRQVLQEMNAQHLLKYFDEALKSFPRFELSISDSTRLPDETWNQKICDEKNELSTQGSKCKSLTYFDGSLIYKKKFDTEIYLLKRVSEVKEKSNLDDRENFEQSSAGHFDLTNLV